MGYPHPTSPSSRYGFDHDRITNPFGHGNRVLLIFHHSFRTGWGWDAGLFCQDAADGLVLQRIHGAGVRPNKANVAALADIRKMSILGQETVPWVDGVDVGDFSCANNAINPKIALVG